MTIWNPQLSKIDGPRYQAIADAIENDIRKGRIEAGFQLPTHRDLADQLKVTVGTVTRGYAEAARRGLLRGETGRGTFVGSVSNRDDSHFEHSEDTPQDAVDMGMTLPLNHLDPDLSSTFAHLATTQDIQSSLRYFPSRGRHQDRELGAEWLKNYHLNPCPENILITAGGQHALTVILGAVFRPGDSIAVETITYPLIKSLSRRFGLRLVPIEMDREGMNPNALASACSSQKIHGIYCMPTLHNPTTSSMSDSRRQALAKVAQEQHLYVIEDDAYAQLSDTPFSPIANYCPERSFYVASMSKAVTSGLRFGYLTAPESFSKRLEHAIADTVWMASPLSARIARYWIESGIAQETILKKKNESKLRNQLARKIFTGTDLHTVDTGYFVWLELPDAWNGVDFAKQASEKRVYVTPLEHYLVGRNRPEKDAVRIAISGPTNINDLERGLIVIRDLLQ